MRNFLAASPFFTVTQICTGAPCGMAWIALFSQRFCRDLQAEQQKGNLQVERLNVCFQQAFMQFAAGPHEKVFDQAIGHIHLGGKFHPVFLFEYAHAANLEYARGNFLDGQGGGRVARCPAAPVPGLQRLVPAALKDRQIGA